jgi:hypothetical protein
MNILTNYSILSEWVLAGGSCALSVVESRKVTIGWACSLGKVRNHSGQKRQEEAFCSSSTLHRNTAIRCSVRISAGTPAVL